MYSILCVEDDLDVAKTLNYNLQSICNRFDHVVDGKTANRAINTGRYDLLLLDLNLPDIDGLVLCRALRDNNCSIPIIILTGYTSIQSCVKGLDSGADDYIRKPFKADELKARVKALLRRQICNRELPSSLVKGDLVVNSRERLVTRGNEKITLTNKEFDLLEYLVRHEGQVFSRSQLLDAVWGFAYGGFDHTVNSHVNRLRSKLEKDPDKPEYVLTVWGVGYKFDKSSTILR